MGTRVFIDGEAGTTGLEIAERLRRRADLTVLSIDPAARKDPEARARLLAEADVSVLCLPDDAAREAVALAGSQSRLIDASSAHRVDPQWVYGLPELDPEARERIRHARLVANPGCYAQGFVLLVRPLIDAGIIPADLPLRIHAVSGYSGGGRSLIEQYRGFDADTAERLNSRPYALGLTHKHVPEMQRHAGTAVTPLFAPMVANFYRGSLLHVPLFVSELSGAPNRDDLREVLARRYTGEPFVRVLATGAEDALEGGYLDATACNHSNRIELMVFGNDRQILLAARYDNLGKGASGVALQSLNLMLGVDETLGLCR